MSHHYDYWFEVYRLEGDGGHSDPVKHLLAIREAFRVLQETNMRRMLNLK